MFKKNFSFICFYIWLFIYVTPFLPADVTTRFDQVFWFGDFNFRLSKNRVEVENIINRTVGSEMEALLEHDQLSKEIKDGSLY